MEITKRLTEIADRSNDRFDLWKNFVKAYACENIAEVGVYKGDYAKVMLSECDSIQKYYLIDPWRNLNNWNKPANEDNNTFNAFYEETLKKTDFAADKRIILRGKTTEVIDEIPDMELDFAYIDGDHTLKGITIDLVNLWDKISPSGFLVGDDFVETMWQHNKSYEPTLVFPFAVYFAEAVDQKIFALPFKQFLISKQHKGFEFIDLTGGKYDNTEMLYQFLHAPQRKKSIKSSFVESFPGLYKLYKSLKS